VAEHASQQRSADCVVGTLAGVDTPSGNIPAVKLLHWAAAPPTPAVSGAASSDATSSMAHQPTRVRIMLVLEGLVGKLENKGNYV
jgi:hypothetical protein